MFKFMRCYVNRITMYFSANFYQNWNMLKEKYLINDIFRF